MCRITGRACGTKVIRVFIVFFMEVKRRMTPKYPTISLFSGAMGLDLGLELSGFSTQVCVEIDTNCQDTIIANKAKIGKDKMEIFSDINQLSSKDLYNTFFRSSGTRDVTLIAGGPPCQAFSTAGKRLSINDPRGRLVHKYFSIIEDLRPRFFVFENVRGILSAALKHRPLSERGEKFPPLEPEEQLGSLLNLVILPKWKQLGYQVIHGSVIAADYGTPQVRERVLFIGSRDKEFSANNIHDIDALLKRTHSKNGENGLPKWRTLKDAIGDLDCHHDYIPYSEKRKTVYDKIPPGENWRFLRDNYSEDYVKQVMGGAFKSTGGRVGFWRRLDYDKPSPTLTTSPLQKSTGLCHPEITRPLSVQEYARVQEFPDWWEFKGSVTNRYKQIGNAVPISLGRAIGSGIMRLLEEAHNDN